MGPTGNLQIDCGPEMRLQLTREQIYDLEAVLITHTHADHVMGMDDLRSICVVGEKVVPVYSMPRYQEDIRRIFPYAFAETIPGIWVPRFDLMDVPEVIRVGGMEVRTFEVQHGKYPVTGVRVNDFAFLTDVNHIPPAALEMLWGLDTLVIDSVRHEPHPNHFHFEATMAVIEELKPRRAFLTHLSHEFDHNSYEAGLPENVRLAFDGLRIGF